MTTPQRFPEAVCALCGETYVPDSPTDAHVETLDGTPCGGVPQTHMSPAAARLSLMEAVITTALSYGMEGQPQAGLDHLARIYPDLAGQAQTERPERRAELGLA